MKKHSTSRFLFLFLAFLMAFTTPSCTPAQWQRFQEINTKVAGYVQDAMLALGIVKGVVDVAVPAADRSTFSDVYGDIQAVNEALQAEAGAVRNSPTPMDTPAQLGAAFPQFLDAWTHLQGSLQRHGLASSSAPPSGARLASQRMNGIPIPALVRDAHR